MMVEKSDKFSTVTKTVFELSQNVNTKSFLKEDRIYVNKNVSKDNYFL